MGTMNGEEYFEIKRHLETFIHENNELMEKMVNELIAVRVELNTLNKIFGRATVEIEKASKKGRLQ